MYFWQICYCIAKHYRYHTAYLHKLFYVAFHQVFNVPKKLTFFQIYYVMLMRPISVTHLILQGELLLKKVATLYLSFTWSGNYNVPKEQYFYQSTFTAVPSPISNIIKILEYLCAVPQRLSDGHNFPFIHSLPAND